MTVGYAGLIHSFRFLVNLRPLFPAKYLEQRDEEGYTALQKALKHLEIMAG